MKNKPLDKRTALEITKFVEEEFKGQHWGRIEAGFLRKRGHKTARIITRTFIWRVEKPDGSAEYSQKTKLLGFGQTWTEAIEDARQHLPERDDPRVEHEIENQGATQSKSGCAKN